MTPEYTPAQLLAMALALSDRTERVAAIHGFCISQAEAGNFQVVFDRTDYLISDFDDLKQAHFNIEKDGAHIYVCFDPTK